MRRAVDTPDPDDMTLRDRIAYADSLLPGVPAPDGEEDPRWQVMLAIEDDIETDPEPIWEFISRWGDYPQEDLRNAISYCLLEHLLEHHFDRYFERVRALALAKELFADTFSRCWKFGQAKEPGRTERFDELQAWCSARFGD